MEGTQMLRPSLEQLQGRKDLIGVEIGVEFGLNAEDMIQHLDIRTLFLIDSYHADAVDRPGVFITPEEAAEAKSAAIARLSGYDCTRWIFAKSQEVPTDQLPSEVDFIYIDAGHEYADVRKDLERFYPLVRPGGLVAGHDYDAPGGVKQAVDEFAATLGVGITKRVDKLGGRQDWWFWKETNVGQPKSSSGRTIGVMSIWGRELFVPSAVLQATELLVDELYMTTCCMHPELSRFADTSEELARICAKDMPNAHYVETSIDDRIDWSCNMARVLNQLLAAGKPEEGDLVWLLDVDEFYPEETVGAAMAYLEVHPGVLSLRFDSLFVGPDMCHAVGHAHTRLHRYSRGRSFVPTSMFAPVVETSIIAPPMYHYSLAVPFEYKDTFWKIEFGSPVPPKQEVKRRWWREIHQNYDVRNEQDWMAKNEKLTGHHGFWFSDACREQPKGGLLELPGGDTPVHPTYAAALAECIGDSREFFAGPADPAPAPVPVEDLKPRQAKPSTGFQINFTGGTGSGTPLLAGPWAGEFGYELMFWIPTLRALAPKFREVVVVVPTGHEVLYEGITQSIVTHDLDLGSSRWMANSGDAKFWNGGWEGLADPRSLAELASNLRQWAAGHIVIEPMKELFLVPPVFTSYRQPGDREESCLLLHCRRAGHGRDWPSAKFDELCHELNKHYGVIPRIVGTTSDYLPRGVTVMDWRTRPDESLRVLIEHLSRAVLIAGASSGVIHLASLCETPHVVWGDGSFPIPEVGTSKEAYLGAWNPFDTPVEYIDSGWDPDVTSVLNAIVRKLHLA